MLHNASSAQARERVGRPLPRTTPTAHPARVLDGSPRSKDDPRLLERGDVIPFVSEFGQQRLGVLPMLRGSS